MRLLLCSSGKLTLSPSPSPVSGRGGHDSAGEVKLVEIPLKYRFEPGHVLDGVTATIPLALLNQLNPVQTEWLVPGMLREKLTYLIKALPKAFRRVCVPVPEFVTGFLEYIGNDDYKNLPLLETLAAYIQHKTTLKISKDDWNLNDIPLHHLMNFSVVDDAGRELAMGRDWYALKNSWGRLHSSLLETLRRISKKPGSNSGISVICRKL